MPFFPNEIEQITNILGNIPHNPSWKIEGYGFLNGNELSQIGNETSKPFRSAKGSKDQAVIRTTKKENHFILLKNKFQEGFHVAEIQCSGKVTVPYYNEGNRTNWCFPDLLTAIAALKSF